MKETKVYTDGACSGNPGAGGWGVVIINDKDILKYSGYEKETTNNRMELKAAIEGINKLSIGSKIILSTDSKYVKDGITTWVVNWKINNWMTSAKQPVKNQDLWKKLDDLNHSYSITWVWVKAHQDNNTEEGKYNNMADELARSAIV